MSEAADILSNQLLAADIPDPYRYSPFIFDWEDIDFRVMVSYGINRTAFAHKIGSTVYVTTPALIKNGQAVELIEKLVNQLNQNPTQK